LSVGAPFVGRGAGRRSGSGRRSRIRSSGGDPVVGGIPVVGRGSGRRRGSGYRSGFRISVGIPVVGRNSGCRPGFRTLAGFRLSVGIPVVGRDSGCRSEDKLSDGSRSSVGAPKGRLHRDTSGPQVVRADAAFHGTPGHSTGSTRLDYLGVEPYDAGSNRELPPTRGSRPLGPHNMQLKKSGSA
jgi:hypothetical protein